MNLTTLLLAVAGTDAVEATSAPSSMEVFAERLLFTTVDVGIVVIALAIVLCVVQILRGPSLVDRGVSGDVISVQVVALVLLLTIRLETLLFFDAVLIVGILGFAATVAFAQYLGRRRSVA